MYVSSIANSTLEYTGDGGGQPDPLKDYTDRLIKLVPAEIVGLYMAGKVAINDRYPIGGPKPAGALLSESAAWIGWTLFCLIALVVSFVDGLRVISKPIYHLSGKR